MIFTASEVDALWGAKSHHYRLPRDAWERLHFERTEIGGYRLLQRDGFTETGALHVALGHIARPTRMVKL